MGEVSVIIVSWNGCDYLRSCLRSVLATGGSIVREIIVIDNASADGSSEMVTNEFPMVKLTRLKDNLGFAQANNLGIQQAEGDFLALINSDVVVHAECFQTLAAFLKAHPEVGLVGPSVTGRDGLPQSSCAKLPTLWSTMCRFVALDRFFPKSRLFSGYQVSLASLGNQVDVEVLSGCFWLARRSAVDTVGMLDERFFFYAEDFDWCRRFKDLGWRICFVKQAKATHFGGGSSANAPLRFGIEMMRSNLIYWQKHHGSFGRIAFFVLAVLLHAVRLVPRGISCSLGFDNSNASRTKLQEHYVCLRWLLTGKRA